MTELTGKPFIVYARSYHSLANKHRYRRGIVASEPRYLFGERVVDAILESRGRESGPYQMTIPTRYLRSRTKELEDMLKEKGLVHGKDDAALFRSRP